VKIDENNFIEQIKKKNPKAIEFVVDKYINLVFKVVRTVLNSKFEAQHSEECVNDVFWAVWNNKEKVKNDMKVNHDGNFLMDYDYWAAYDDKGIELMTKGSGVSGNSNTGIFNVEMQYNKLSKIPKYLTIVPCKITPSGGECVGTDENGKEVHYAVKSKKSAEISKTIDGVYPIELSQGKMGKITIEKIETNNDSTTVKYRVEGKAPYFQAQSLWIKDSNGKEVDYKSYDIRKDDSKPDEFVRQFKKLDPNKKYTIVTNDFSNVEFREDLKFKINLK